MDEPPKQKNETPTWEPSTSLTSEPLAPLLSLPQEGNNLLPLNKDDHELKTDFFDEADASLTSNEPETHPTDLNIKSNYLPLTLEPLSIDPDSPLDRKRPPLDVRNPPLGVENSPLDVKNPPLDVGNPPLDVENPPLCVENPPPSVVGGIDPTILKNSQFVNDHTFTSEESTRDAHLDKLGTQESKTVGVATHQILTKPLKFQEPEVTCRTMGKTHGMILPSSLSLLKHDIVTLT